MSKESMFSGGTIHLNKPSLRPVTVSEPQPKTVKMQTFKPDCEFTGELKGAAIKGRHGRDLPLMVIPMDEMKRRHKVLPDSRGTPVFVAVDGKSLWVHPSPNAPYELVLR